MIPYAGSSYPCGLPVDLSHTRDKPGMELYTWHAKWKTNGISILFDGIIYFARSWSGVLVYKAAITFMDTQAIISNIDAIRQTTIGGSWVTICAVDFLVKSHLYRREAPHILPPSIPDDEMGIAAYSFQEYGRWASFATYEDTTRITHG